MLALLVSLAFAGKPVVAAEDAAATTALKAEADAMLKQVDSGDFAGMLGKMTPNATAFDTDMQGAPVAMHGSDELKKYFDTMGTAMKEQPSKIASQITRNDCWATATMGFCAMEFSQTFGEGDKSQSMKFRGTLVAAKMKEGWKWTHWHGSLAEMPPAPPAPEPVPAAETTPPAADAPPAPVEAPKPQK